MTEPIEKPETFKDPVTGNIFSTKLSDEQITEIMKLRFELDKAAEKIEADNALKAEELLKQLDALHDEEKAAYDKIDEFDTAYMPGIRATVLNNREQFHRNDTITPHYVISTSVYKTKKPKYDAKDTNIVAWAKQNHPETIKPPEIAKSKLNTIFKGMDDKDLPDGVTLELPDSKVSITRLE